MSNYTCWNEACPTFGKEVPRPDVPKIKGQGAKLDAHFACPDCGQRLFEVVSAP